MLSKALKSLLLTSMLMGAKAIDFAPNDQSISVDKPTNVPLVQKLMSTVWERMTPAFEGKTKAVIMDHPDHKNRGDSAIYAGEVAFLEYLGVEIVYECASYGDHTCNTTYVKDILDVDTGVVLMHGGGNFGDIYTYFDGKRQEYILDLKEYRVVMFPQTIFYFSMDAANVTAAKYATVPDLTIAVRDQYSYDVVTEYFSANKAIESPDMAFMLGPQEKYGTPSVDIILVLRKDTESKLHMEDVNEYIRSLINDDNITFAVGDWEDGDVDNIWEVDTLTKRAQIRTNDALKFLSQGRVAISDRLHAHILSTLLDLPHVCMDNFYGKVTKFHNKWMQSQDPRMAQLVGPSLERAVELALQMLKQQKQQ